MKLFAIGMGTGDPAQLTGQAMQAIGDVDVFLVADKGDEKADLVACRRAVCSRYGKPGHRIITMTDPKRGPDAQRDARQYHQGVVDWHAARVAAYREELEKLSPDAVVGFLVWGDPAFYDSTLRIIDQLLEGDIAAEVVVIPGISAPQVLAAAHRIALNRVGCPIHITTGRRLVEEFHPGLGDVVVMLDGHLACQQLVAKYPDLWVYWGAYLGAPHQVLRSGRLADRIDELIELRAELRTRHGWIMDTYLLRS